MKTPVIPSELRKLAKYWKVLENELNSAANQIEMLTKIVNIVGETANDGEVRS